MTELVELQIEEPVCSNPNIDAVDEDSRRIVLAEFSLERVSRYTFLWPHHCEAFASHCIDTLEAISELSPKPTKCVSGWLHDTDGFLRMRHKVLVSNLTKSGWDVVAQRDLGIALSVVPPGGLRSLVNSLQMPGLGWFLAFGDWCAPEVLTQPPFLASMKSFCCGRRLTPSRQFLDGLAERGGAVAYAAASDDRRPGAIVVSSKRMEEAALRLVATRAAT